MKVSRSKKLAHEEGLASYQLVGGVMAYQGDDVSWSERMISHTGTGTRARLLREAAVRNFCAMGAILTQQRRVGDEGLRVVKPCQVGRMSWR